MFAHMFLCLIKFTNSRCSYSHLFGKIHIVNINGIIQHCQPFIENYGGWETSNMFNWLICHMIVWEPLPSPLHTPLME